MPFPVPTFLVETGEGTGLSTCTAPCSVASGLKPDATEHGAVPFLSLVLAPGSGLTAFVLTINNLQNMALATSWSGDQRDSTS